MFLSRVLLLLLAASGSIRASRLVSETLESYRAITDALRGPSQNVDVEMWGQLLQLHDDDATCGEACMRYLEQKWGGKTITWERLENLIDSLYDGMISDDPYEPQEIKLALTDEIDEMKVMFLTKSLLDDPIVEFKSAPASADEQWVSVAASWFTYSVPHDWWPTFDGEIYEANLGGLSAGMEYVYRVGGYDTANETQRYSQEFTFRAPPERGANAATTIGVMADQGTFMLLGFAVADKLAELQDELDIDVVHVVGDLSYAGLSTDFDHLNFTKEDEFERIWDLYGIQSQPFAATRPFMVSNGNHERFYDWAGYKNRFHMPYQKSGGSADGFWYSWEHGNVHWTSVSSEHSLDAGSEQMDWLQADLKKAQSNRVEVPWIVVSIHKPLYSSDARSSMPSSFQQQLESLLLEIDVDLVLVGHMHCYERIHPVNNYNVTVFPSEAEDGTDVYSSQGKGPVHVVQGNSGAAQAETWVQPQPIWSAVRFSNGLMPRNRSREGLSEEEREQDEEQSRLLLSRSRGEYSDTFGFGLIEAINRTHLCYKMVPVSGEIGKDVFWIVKEH